MDVISYSKLRNDLSKMLDKVNDDHAPLIITRRRGKPAVLISLEDFHSYDETAYLLRSPQNAARLYHAKREIEAGKGRVHKLVK